MLALIDAAGFRSAAQLSETEFAAALIAGLLPPAVGLVNGVPHWSNEQARTFIEYAEREVLARHSGMANALISGAAAVRSMPPRTRAPAPNAKASQPPTIPTPSDDERLNEEMAADFLGLPVEAMRLSREGGSGPAWTKNGSGKIVYRVGDLRAFQAEAKRIDTHKHSDRTNLDIHAAARYCGYTVETFKSYTKPSSRAFGKGPAFVKVRGEIGQRGGKIEYRPDDLDAWLAAHHKGRYRSTEARQAETIAKPKPDKKLTTKQVAKLAGVTIATLAWYRNQRMHNVAGHEHGPEFVKEGPRRIFYWRTVVDAWLASRKTPPRKLSKSTLATRVASLAKARAVKEAKRQAKTVIPPAIQAKSKERETILAKIEACGKQAEDFALDNALTHGKATLAHKLGAKVVLKAGTPHAHSKMPELPAQE